MVSSKRSVLVALALLYGSMSCAYAQGPVEKTVPQGKDPPGNEQAPSTSSPENKGVITPPAIGDKDIYTNVPNPNAGHEKEVIPPPGTPGGNPNVEPR